MFTGLVQEVGSVAGVRTIGGGRELTIAAPSLAPQVHVDDSVAVNGVCQTIIRCDTEQFTMVAVEETLRKTTLGSLRSGSRVNLELALRPGDRLGGHFVQGHVDGVGEVVTIRQLATSREVTFRLPKEFMKYIIPVGSIAIDGVSLTVASRQDTSITVAIIPHTLQSTIFQEYNTGSRVNIECDMLGKYVESILKGETSTGLTHEKLRSWGVDRSLDLE